MHLPNYILNLPVTAAASAISLGTLAFTYWHAPRHLPSHRVPLLGLSAAFIFAAQSAGFSVDAQRPTLTGLLADYAIPGLGGYLSTAVAGAIGVLLVVGAATLLSWVLERRQHVYQAAVEPPQ